MSKELEYNDIIAKIPPKVREIFESPEYYSRFEQIASNNGLNVEQTGELMTEVVLVMAGLTAPSEFMDELKQNSILPKDSVVDIAKDIEEEIFSSIKQDLIRAYNQNKPEKKPETSVQALKPEVPVTNPKISETPSPMIKEAKVEIQKREEALEKREDIMKNIEDRNAPQPISSSPGGKTLIQDKLEHTVKLPRETKEKEDGEGKPVWKQPMDPYREPFE